MAGKKGHRVLPPCEAMDPAAASYNLSNMQTPRLAGWALRLFTWFLEGPLGGLVLPKLKRDSGIPQVLHELDMPEGAMFFPQFPHGAEEVEEAGTVQIQGPAAQALASTVRSLQPPKAHEQAFKYWTVRDYAQAYATGATTPTKVAERFLQAVADSEKMKPPMRLFIAIDEAEVRKQAAASTERYAAGTPLSVLDGVPVAAKDELDCLPYTTTGGTSFLGKERTVSADAVCITRLRDCGALLLGKTNMIELGMGTTGYNAVFGTPRNPYNVEHFTGGSSSGSAAAVAAGLCPIALGVDGGGSIRIPAALCGVVGLKPTFGRIPMTGVLKIAYSIGMQGPLTASVEDAVIAYAAMAGRCPTDRHSCVQPVPRIPSLSAPSVKGIRIGRYSKWFEHADETVLTACSEALEKLQQQCGVQVQEVVVPELEEMRVAHLCSITGEEAAASNYFYEHGKRGKLSYPTRVGMMACRSFSCMDYVNAQRIRTRAMHHHMRIFDSVDVIVTPTTGQTAPRIPKDVHACGESDLSTTGKLMRFVVAGNFVGLPAITVPVGYDSKGLPIGLQLMGRPWQEATLLQLAVVVEELKTPLPHKPAVYFDLLT